MAAQTSREALMKQLSQLDAEINSISASMPKPTGLQPIPFPLIGWIIGLICVGVWYGVVQGLIPFALPQAVNEYKVVILVVGGVFLLLAAFNSFRWLTTRGQTGQNKQYNEASSRVTALQSKREDLRQQLKEFDA